MAKQSRGTCTFCSKEMTKGGLTRHLSSCSKRKDATGDATGRPETIYHLVVSDAYSPMFWLHLEMRDSAELTHLDHYLRTIWLECCGHLSAFTIGEVQYTQIFDDGFDGWIEQKPMDIAVKKLFNKGMTIPYEYDFGSTSALKIEIKGERKGAPLSEHPIYLMARNNMPDVLCMVCGQPATYLCMECVYEDEEPGLLCEKHADEHPHEDYGEPHALLNSPRVGVCGKIMSDEPPY